MRGGGRGLFQRLARAIGTCLLSALLTVLLSVLLSTPALAHKGSDAYLTVNGDEVLNFTLAVALKDLDLLLPLDANGDALITWAELQAALPSIIQVLKKNTELRQTESAVIAPLSIANTATASTAASTTTSSTDASMPSRCALDWRYSGLESRSDGSYLRVASQARCDATRPVALHYSLLAQEDVTHRLMVVGRVDGQELLLTVAPNGAAPAALRQVRQIRQGDPLRSVSANTSQGVWPTLSAYFLQGVEHLLQGYDHLAFLLALLLPLPLRFSRDAPWAALLRTITAFTLGHSITLALAVLGYTSASSAWVEPAIALSIGVSASLNLWPGHRLPSAALAAAFGLVHGYGFAGLLTQAAAPSGLLGWALAGFNLGIEAGQLLAVLAWVCLSQAVSAKPWYAPVVVRGGSVLLVALSLYWVGQRVG